MLRKLVRLLRPRGGWLLLTLLLATVVCLPLAIHDAKWLAGASSLVPVALLAAWLGYTFGHTPLPGWLVGALGILSGLEWSIWYIGRLAPSFGSIVNEVAHGLRWLQAGVYGQWGADLPFQRLVWGVSTRAFALYERLGSWLQASMTGTVSYDSVVLLLFVAIGTWWVSYFAGWQVARGRSALVALMPAGIAIVSNVSLTYGAGTWYLRGYLGGALALMACAYFERLQGQWERQGLDYSLELRQSTQLVGIALASALILVTMITPYVTWRQAVDFFWRYAYEPWNQVTQRLDRMFAGRNPIEAPAQRTGSGSGPSGDSHQLSGEPSLSEDIVFYVTTSDPAPLPPEVYMEFGEEPENPQHYWREMTYDTYTGRGWANSESRRTRRTASDLLVAPLFPHTLLTQTFELVTYSGGVAPAASQPLRLDRPYTAIERGDDDLAGLIVGERKYTIVSAIPAPTISELREAGTVYPPEIASRYLALPKIPERVRTLARDLTAEATTPYDKAAIIERHLRAFEYDLQIAAPPPGEDVVDYLLYKTRRGYCDYYATAMVVMLRAVGVPARYASGFAMGDYSFYSAAYVVRQRDAHAWAEVYFPGYGWIEFEPTPYRAAFSRPLGGAGSTSIFNLPRTRQTRRTLPLLSGLLLLVGSVVALGGIFWWTVRALRSRQDLTSARLARQVYGQMLRWAEWVRLGPAPGDTPLEFSERLGQMVEARAAWAKGAAEEAQIIGHTYVRARYSPAPLSAHDAGRALTAWSRLQRKLRWLLFWRRR